MLCIFHEGLLGKHPVLEGADENTKIILNTTLSPEEAMEKWPFKTGELYCVDALQIAMKCHSRINMVLLGAIAKVSGFIPLSSIENMCRDTIGQKYPALIQSNLDGVKQGYECVSEGLSIKKQALQKDSAPQETFFWGYDNAPKGGVNPRFGSSVSNDLSPSREGYIPLFLQEKCINCGLCSTTCPDMAYPDNPSPAL